MRQNFFSDAVNNQKTWIRITLFLLLLFPALLILARCGVNQSVLEGKTIVLDPGHGGTAQTDHYRVGPTGEREEWINLRIALKLEELMLEQGATVLLTRSEDEDTGLEERAMLAVNNNADLFISIHHNAIADTSVNFPVIYFHGNSSENKASVQLGINLGKEINNALFDGEKPVLVGSDHTIFPNSGTAVLRHSYGIPGVITEASFFTNAREEERLKNTDYNLKEAEALLRGILAFFSDEQPLIHEKYSNVQLPPFSVLQAAGRMSEEVKGWKEAYEKAAGLRGSDNPDDIRKAYDYASESAHLFPDSPLAKEAHLIRAEALKKLGRTDEAETEKRRAKEFYKMIYPR
ncbi:hypothetical protein BH23BAC3_BH23BAC3_19170 [soil metagenome]